MLAWRIFAGVLAVLLVAVVAIDVGVEKNRPERVLLYDKGVYLGQPDTGIDDETRQRIRQRGRTAAGDG